MMTKQEKDRKIYRRFGRLVEQGYSIMQATKRVMKEYNILSSMTVYNIRKRCEQQ